MVGQETDSTNELRDFILTVFVLASLFLFAVSLWLLHYKVFTPWWETQMEAARD